MNESEKLVNEIQQIIIQYQSEVGRGRKAWTKSIRTRVDELYGLSLPGTAIAKLTGLPYFTVLKMRSGKIKALKQIPGHKESFYSLPVVEGNTQKVSTVTATRLELKKVVSVTVTTPDGYQIQVPSDFIFSVLVELRRERD